jgi:ribosomal protein L9
MVEDYPAVGFEGEIVEVKPKYAASFLIPNRLAVYNLPGVYNRIFPNFEVRESFGP